MDQIHKDALRRTRVALVKDLDVDSIADYLLTNDIFTPLMMEYIQAERTRIDKVRRLLDDLVRRGPRAYELFLHCLREGGYKFLAEAIQYNEYIIRREKDPNCSIPVQASSDPQSEIRPSSGHQSLMSNATEISITKNLNNSYSGGQMNNSSSQTTRAGGLVIQEIDKNESNSVQPSSNEDDDLLDLEPNLGLNSTESNMDVDDEMDAQTEAQLLTDNQPQLSDVLPSQPEDNSHPPYFPYANYSLIPSMTSPYQSSFSSSKCYKMESTPRGMVMIINNKDFRHQQATRDGTEKDCRNLQSMFTSLGFEVIIYNNLTGSQMIQHLQNFAKDQRLENVDSLIVAILSHGTCNIIYGVDEMGISVQDIPEIFTVKGCPKMCTKPKLFILNACRGDRGDESIHIGSTVSDNIKTDAPGDELISRIDGQRVANHQDILLAQSTYPGHTSYRDTEDGSWFIQKLVEVFEEQCNTEHVLDMLTEVNLRVARIYNDDSSQIPFPSTSLTKKWYLNPLQQS